VLTSFHWYKVSDLKNMEQEVRNVFPKEGDYVDMFKPWPITGKNAYLWMKLIGYLLDRLKEYFGMVGIWLKSQSLVWIWSGYWYQLICVLLFSWLRVMQ